MKRIGSSIIAASIVMLSACDLSPNFTMPAVGVPAGYKEPTANASPAPVADGKWQRFDDKAKLDETAWWQLFNDPALNALEEQAMKDNPSLDASMARVKAARAEARIAKSDFFPTVTAGFGPTRQKISPASITSQFPQAGVTTTKPFTLYDARGTVTYDIDLFGKTRNSWRAALFGAESAEQDYRAARLALQADLAQAYFSAIAYTMEAKVLEQTVKSQTDSLGLLRKKRDVGEIDDLQVSAQETDLANARQAAAQVAQAKAMQEHLIAILVGQPPAAFALRAGTVSTKPPAVPAGLPSALLERRPDLQSAVKKMEEANAEIGVARAGYFPDLSLTVLGGFTSSEIGDLFKWSNRTWLIGPLAGTMLTQPVFNGGVTQARVAESRADYQEAVANYRTSVLQAFREVEDQLSGLQNLNDEAAASGQAVKSAGHAFGIAKARYSVGYSSYLEFLDAQRNYLAAQRGDVQVMGNRYIAAVQLIRALGGRWDATVEKPPAVTSDTQDVPEALPAPAAATPDSEVRAPALAPLH